MHSKHVYILSLLIVNGYIAAGRRSPGTTPAPAGSTVTRTTDTGTTAAIVGSRWVKYTPGNINLIFTVPHNGAEKPQDIPDRVNGCKGSNGVCSFPGSARCSKSDVCEVATKADAYTRSIAEIASNRIKTLLRGVGPHVVVNKLHRSKMDPNREEVDGTQGNRHALTAYRSMHRTIKQVRASLVGPGLILDFHGQTHGYNSTELGYLIRKGPLNSGNLPPASSTSIFSLVTRFNHTLEDCLSGKSGLGSRIEHYYNAIPSPRQPTPGSHQYWPGGWITKSYGSKDGGQIDAIQLEMPSEIRLGGPEVRAEFGKRMGDAILEFFNAFYL